MELLVPGDVLVLNDSKVFPARLRGVKTDTAGSVEILLLESVNPLDWWVLLRPGKRVRPGTRLRFEGGAGPERGVLEAEVVEKNAEGHCRLRFDPVDDFFGCVARIGEIPLPPYIESQRDRGAIDDRERYQTVYANEVGSVAAPTAGLHFTTALLEALEQRGIEIRRVTLHVGAGTFLPVKVEDVSRHRMHSERFSVSPTTADAIERARAEGRRIVSVGTTSTRVLESVAARNGGRIVAGAGTTDIFIHPPYRFAVVDALITNFHLPQSTLLMLVSAFCDPGGLAGRDTALQAYRTAVNHRYRFFSYGDAMFVQGGRR